MRVLVTRPSHDALVFAERLKLHGHAVVLSPVLVIAPVPFTPPDFAQVQAILFSSANGVRAFAANSSERSIPAVCVGPASAQSAKLAGFKTVKVAAGEGVTGLLELARTLHREHGGLLYIRGAEISADLSGLLTRDGYEVTQIIAYRAAMASTLEPEAAAYLQRGEIECVTFFSNRSLEVYLALCNAAGLSGAGVTPLAVCLSEKIATMARTSFSRVLYARHATEEGVLAEIDKADQSS
ncbi:MAG TPA: hypothetical protein DCL54_13600 [Alphaproteobacteria bacterium]|nr:hypothetical protein [Alphaproteobacteria bacterium]